MLKKLVLLSAVPLSLLVMMQPAEARRLFWWETVNPDAPPPGYYDPQQDVYADPYGGYGTPQDRFNARQYELYRREMARRYGNAAYQDPSLDYGYDGPPPPYADPVYPQPRKVVKKKPIAQKPVVKTVAKAKPAVAAPGANDGLASTTASTTPATAPVATAQAQPAKPKAGSSTVTCEKGQDIVTSFGFANVASKSCAGKSLVYSAERGGNKFEVEVNAASGELTAVRKL